jgi:hypothetical protein
MTGRRPNRPIGWKIFANFPPISQDHRFPHEQKNGQFVPSTARPAPVYY